MPAADWTRWITTLRTLPDQFADLHLKFRTLRAAIDNLENRVTTAEQNETAADERFAGLLATAIAEIRSVRDEVAAFPAALADAYARGDQAGAEKLVADAIRDTERTNRYADMLADLYPATVPDVDVPPAGEPAEPPPGSGVEVPEVPEVPEPVVDIPLDTQTS